MTVFFEVAAAIAAAGAIAVALPPLGRFLVAAAKVPVVLEKVAQEFSANGGGSMRDSIDRLELAAEKGKEWQIAHMLSDMKFEEYVKQQLVEVADTLVTATSERGHLVEMTEKADLHLHEVADAVGVPSSGKGTEDAHGPDH